ncbi:MAG TPA: CopD family protein [Gaiellaceae bacterium]|nr:CopD family protein [Gaiellaceae bacterium]
MLVAVPPVQRLEGEARAKTLRAFGKRWRPIGWSALGVAILTGVVLAGRDGAFDTAPSSFDWVLAVKGLCVGLLVAGAYLHDYVLGPALAEQIREGHPQTLRRRLVLIGRANFGLTLLIPLLGAVLAEIIR